jgi:hypothetical protein
VEKRGQLRGGRGQGGAADDLEARPHPSKEGADLSIEPDREEPGQGEGHDRGPAADERLGHLDEAHQHRVARAGVEECPELEPPSAQPGEDGVEAFPRHASVGRVVLPRGRGIGLDPASAGQPHLEPGVGVGFADDVVRADPVGLAHGEAAHVAGGNALQP